MARRGEELRGLARADREDDRHLKTFKPAQFEGAETRSIELKFPNAHVHVHGQRLLLELRDAEFLFPLHDGIRDPAAQRRADRQRRLSRQLRKSTRALRSDGIPQSRPHRRQGEPALPRHDDVRAAAPTSGLDRDHRARARARASTSSTPRTSTPPARANGSSARRSASDKRRASVVLATKVFFPAGREGPERAGHQPPPHHRGVRRVARALADRLDRSVSAASRAVRDPDRRDAARARRSDPRRQDALHRHEHVRRAGRSSRRFGRRRSSA